MPWESPPKGWKRLGFRVLVHEYNLVSLSRQNEGTILFTYIYIYIYIHMCLFVYL